MEMHDFPLGDRPGERQEWDLDHERRRESRKSVSGGEAARPPPTRAEASPAPEDAPRPRPSQRIAVAPFSR